MNEAAKLTIVAASTLLSACALLSGVGDLTVGADGADDGGERDAARDGRGDGLVIEDAPARDAAGDALFDASRDVDADAPAVVDLGPPCLSAVALQARRLRDERVCAR